MILAYADDLIIFGNYPVDIKWKLIILKKYCNENHIIVNTGKTKILKFHRGHSPEYNFTYDDTPIETVNS